LEQRVLLRPVKVTLVELAILVVAVGAVQAQRVQTAAEAELPAWAARAARV
jgi:hypothetical protein